jgi:hypothetical protein
VQKVERNAMKPVKGSDFRAKRWMLEEKDFAVASGKYIGPTDLIDENTWRSIVGLPDDVSVRTSDKYGSQIGEMWRHWGTWGRVVLAVQALSSVPAKSSTAIACCDAADEFQAAAYCALVGYYRVAFSCLRNVLEQFTIAVQLATTNDAQDFADWRNAEERIRFGWAADMIVKNPVMARLEKHLGTETKDSLFNQNPKGMVRRLFAEFSKYTHGVSGFTDADSRESNGPIFVPKTFLDWCVASLKTYAIALHLLKLAHPQLDDLPYGPPTTTLDEFRGVVVGQIPTSDSSFFRSLADFWH